jgi:hypothetical protein
VSDNGHESLELQAYTFAEYVLDEYKSLHSEIMQELFERQEAVRITLDALKEHARTYGPEENSRFAVLVQAKSRKWFDTDYILQACPWVETVPGVIVRTVDKDAIVALVKGKIIPEEFFREAQRVEALTPAVTIIRKKV